MMMPVLSSCLKKLNTYVSQDCFSINWLVIGSTYWMKFPNVSLRGGSLDFRFGGFAQFLVSCAVCGFSPILSLLLGFRQL